MKIAIVTGASAGLGKAYAHELAEQYKTLDEIWLIARRKERLEEIKKKYPGRVIRPVQLDLSDEASYGELKALLAQHKPRVEILVSNAGVLTSGIFADTTLDAQLSMVNLNAKACVALAMLCLPYMGKGSYIVHTGSVCAFSPIKQMSVYCASKGFLMYFSQALRAELKSRGINVCIVCPGNMDTEMTGRAELMKQKKQGDKSIINRLPFHDTKVLVRKSLHHARKGRAVYTPGALYKLYRVATKVFPHSWIMFFARV